MSLLAAIIFSLPGSAQHKAWRQYTINDGLPGNEVYDMLQDSRGYMWFVTDRGICRFNGYEFIRPVDTSAYVGTEAFLPTEDNLGRIWFARLDNSIWFVENDTVNHWPLDSIIRQYRDKVTILDQMGIAESGEVWLGFYSLGFLVVDPNGGHRIIRGSILPNILYTEVYNKVVYAFQTTDTFQDRKVKEGFSELVFYKDGNCTSLDQSEYKDQRVLAIEKGAWRLQSGGILALMNGMYAVIEGNRVTNKFHSGIIAEKIIQTTKGEVLIASYRGPHIGLHFFPSLDAFQQGIGENLLKENKVTDIYADHEDGWWVTTKDAGVIYCKNPDIDIYNITSGLNTEDVLRLTNDGEKAIYAGLKSNEIVKIDLPEGRIHSIAEAGSLHDLTALNFDAVQGKLWRSTPLAYFINNRWTQVDAVSGSSKVVNFVNAKDISPDPSSNRAWMSSSLGFSSLDLITNKVNYARNADSTAMTSRTFAVTEDHAGIVWVATSDGLRVWEKDHFDVPPFSHEALKFPIRDIERMADSTIAFGFLGGGVLIRDRTGRLTHLTTKEGMNTNMVSKLKAAGNGVLYACTHNGLHIISKVDDAAWRIKRIDSRQGLPSNLVNDVTLVGSDLWIATDKGLVHLKDLPAVYPVPAPALETFMVDNNRINFSDGIRFPYDQNNISIQFYSLHFRSEGEIVYRYRLNKGDTTFQVSSVRVVNFPKLTPGSYTFEVQAQAEDGGWSKSSYWSFTILPPWWQRWWFVTMMFLLLASGTWAVIRYRIQEYRKNTETSLKIKDLELAALRAQMNPHFIFNCLGSIQQFIVENDSASATRYLARFAKLVRMSLHSSVDGKHSLAEEMEMLDNYLALEQMRFKRKFDYFITTSGDMDPQDIFLPPLLVQPFVENAVVHGIKNISRLGEIAIAFAMQDHILQISVTDNGPGFSTSVQQEDPAHKSVGMTLTRHRLELLSGATDGRTYSQENIMDANGQIQGYRVVIQIPVN